MSAGDLRAVVGLAETLDEAPRWTLAAWSLILDPTARPERLALVAEAEDGRVAGFVVAAVIVPEAELESVAVDRSFQRNGVGRQLMTEVMRRVAERGAPRMTLEVRESNAAALALYAAVGFRVCGRRPGYYTDPREDAILMEAHL